VNWTTFRPQLRKSKVPLPHRHDYAWHVLNLAQGELSVRRMTTNESTAGRVGGIDWSLLRASRTTSWRSWYECLQLLAELANILPFAWLIKSVGRQDSTASVVNRLQVGRQEFRNAEEIHLFSKHPDSAFKRYRLLFIGNKAAGAWGWPLTFVSHLHLMWRLRMSGAIPPLSYMQSCYVRAF
jgi:hypothetical protein